MLGGLLLRLLLATALCSGLLGTAPRSGGRALALDEHPLLATVSAQNLHLCEGYTGPDGRYHPGFYCPRLTDPASRRYCCRPGPRALKSCCSQLAMEALTGVNLSSLASPGLLRNPLALPFVGLYGLLILLLMAVDLFHFYRTRRCRLSRLLPRTRRPPCGPPGGRQPRSRLRRGSRAPGELPPLPRGIAGPAPPSRVC
ncbi:protein shisa-like-1 [Phoenicopterus ruber ruber]